MTYTEDIIKTNIKTDIRWTIRTLEILFNRQTSDEQSDGTTKWRNGRGFNGRESDILTSYYFQIQKRRKYGNPVLLTEKQLSICQRLLPKYWRQVQEEIELRTRTE